MSHAAAVVIDGEKPQTSAAVDVLTAEVRAVMIGNRQVTLSVWFDVRPWKQAAARWEERATGKRPE